MYAIRLEYPEGYYVVRRGRTIELHLDGYGMIEDGIDDELHAICRAQEHDEIDREEKRILAENLAEYAADDLQVAA